MDKTKIIRIVSLAGMALSAIATLVSAYADEERQKETIKKEVVKELDRREREKEGS